MSKNTASVTGIIATLLVSVVFVASPGFAQSGVQGQVELGSYGLLAKHGDSLALDRAYGAGARIGLFLTRAFSLEGSGDYTTTNITSTGARVDVTRIGGTLFGHANLAPWTALYAGAGYELLSYRGALDGSNGGAHLILGQRISLGGRAALRVEGRGTMFPSTTPRAVKLSVSAGLSIYAFGGPPRDADGDLVKDGDDHCPNTPSGATVDDFGCPSDADGDAVLDGLDSCPDTPMGATVDVHGCPADNDGDGVFNGIDLCPATPEGAGVDSSGCPTDEDGDGVFDGLDSCPGTPAGATVDTAGCPSDEDADTVYDGVDMCPGTPQGIAVDDRGCPVDADGDGVLDASDACPDTREGADVDARGCEIVHDSDADGVPDPNDRCPNTQPGRAVDADGCPQLFQIEQGVRRPLVLSGVNFASGRSVLTEESFTTLNEVAASLLAHPEVRVEISGHTDATGSAAINTRLSRERAMAVKAYLARQGVAPERMEAVGYGPDRPIAPNGTPAGRALNRRVELSVLDGGQ